MRKHVTCPYCHIGFSHEFSDSGFEKVSQEQEAFARGRLQGIREMDEAHINFTQWDSQEVFRFREEYQQTN